MLQTVEAEIDIYGNVRLLEPLRVTKPTRALLTLLEDTTAPAEDLGVVDYEGKLYISEYGADEV